MRLYAEVARRSFRRWSTYRAATIAGIFTNSVFGFIRASVLVAVVRTHPGAGGLDAAGVVTYSFLTQGLLAVVNAFGDSEISLRIRTGDVITDLYRPVDFQFYWLAADIGRAVFQLIFRAVPIALVGALTYGLVAPGGVVQAALFMVSIALAVLVGFGLQFVTNLVTFWLLDNRGTNQLVVTATLFFSGLIAPLSLFPSWLETVARALPFACLVQFPLDIFLGRATGSGAVFVLTVQATWAVALLGTGHLVLAAAERKVVIQGG